MRVRSDVPSVQLGEMPLADPNVLERAWTEVRVVLAGELASGHGRLRKGGRRPWPAPDRTVDERKWRVWIATRLRVWRAVGDFHLKEVAAGTGIPRVRVSQLESGRQRLDVVELERLARFYRRDETDIATLFTPPPRDIWAAVVGQYASDPAFRDPPRPSPSGPTL